MYSFSSQLWLYPGDDPWHFVTVPDEISDDVRERTSGSRKGFGSVRVVVTIGDTTWQTSLFPDRKSNAYLLPVKKSVRKGERLEDGDDVDVSFELDEQ